MKSITCCQPTFNIQFTDLWNSPITEWMSGNTFILWTTTCMHETSGIVGWRSHFLICQYINNDSLQIRQHKDKQKKIDFEADLVRTKYCICCCPFPNHKSGFIYFFNKYSVLVLFCALFSLLSMHHSSK